jgi:ankyrin repeat protein
MLRAVLGNGGPVDDLDGESYIPLEMSVNGKDIAHVDCLLSHGANPNFGIDESTIEAEHATALNEMSLSMYMRLRNAGTRFDLREANFHWTPLHYNAKRFQRDTFIQMVKDGLDPNVKDLDGRTPFDALRKDVPKEIFDDVYRQCVRK